MREGSVAIIGAACRFPGGANDLEGYWRLLDSGADIIRDVPPQRWERSAWYDPDPDAVGKTYSTRGAFLDDIEQFDPRFFQVSPTEAKSIAPEQRLMLEVSWEALEHAGIVPEQLRQTSVGVFVGAGPSEYGVPYTGLVPLRDDVYATTGRLPCFGAGRVSYVLGLRGPSLVVDTACSSSLVAVHLACRSLQNGECELALAGAANALLAPTSYVDVSRLRALSPTGRCRAFDDAADGYVRGEGCGVVVLKRLDDALRDGDQLLAVIRGSAINHDGASSGLTVPSRASQEDLLRAALRDAQLRPADVDYVETHGTGTTLGDPIEVGALDAVFAAEPRMEPLLIGSVKTNIGHQESAAGIASLLKLVLSLQHDQLPRQLHLETPTQRIPWQDLSIRVLGEARAWPRTVRLRIAGTSSFGISGTNAHVVVEEAPPVQPMGERAAAPSHACIPMSARSAAALRALAGNLSMRLRETPAPDLRDVGYTSGVHRSAFEHRALAFGADAGEIAQALQAFSVKSETGLVVAGQLASLERPRLAFVFPGQGSQWIGMGRGLLANAAEFRARMQELDAALREWMPSSVLAELTADASHSQLDRIDVIQPVLFAVQVALAAQWQAWGVRPDLVVGHSMGEIAAACVAGGLSLRDAARIVCRRSQLLARLSGRGGAMLAVELPLEEAEALIEPFVAEVSVAANNSPRATVLSGAEARLNALTSELTQRKVFWRWVKSDVAGHSPQLDPLLDELAQLLEGVAPATLTIPMYSTVVSRAVSGAELDAAYWVDNLRQPVRFASAVAQLHAEGTRAFLEISPHPLLLSSVAELGAADDDTLAVPSLGRDKPELPSMFESLGRMWAAGLPVDWARVCAGGRRVSLPTYPFQRKRCWLDAPTVAPVAPEVPQPSAADPLYALQWQTAPLSGLRSLAGDWILVGDSELTRELGANMARHHARVQLLAHDKLTVDELSRVLSQLSGGGRAIRVLYVAQPGAAAYALLAAVNSFLQSGAVIHAFWLVTQGAFTPNAQAALSSAVWGAGRVVQSEHPELGCRLIDVQFDDAVAAAGALLSELTTSSDENQWRLRPGAREVARLVHAPRSDAPRGGALIAPDASYLITGGLGALGRIVARWLVLTHGARNLILASRGEPGPEARETIAELEAAGAHIELARLDVSDLVQVRSLLARTDRAPLRGIFHLACVMDDATVANQTASRFARVFQPKAEGALCLHEASRGLALDHFVLFSSAAGVLGNPGQANYAAANSVLDALALARRAEGLCGLSLAWGLWVEEEGAGANAAGGARNLSQVDRARMAATGVQPITPALGMELLERALRDGATHVVVLPTAPGGFRARGLVPPLFRGLARREDGDDESDGPKLRELLARADKAERLHILQAALRALAARTLGIGDASEIELDRPLMEFGLDSLMALSIRNVAAKQLECWLPAGVVLQHPSLRALAAHLLEMASLVDKLAVAPVALAAVPVVSAMPRARRTKRLAPPVREVSIVRMREPAPTLFLVPPVTGHAEVFLRLMPHLSKHLGVVGLQYEGQTHARPGAFYRELAASFIVKLREVQPAGPYFLFGYSAGGVLSFEMACQLHAAGETVARLINLDGPGPDLLPTADRVTQQAADHVYTLDGALMAGVMLTPEDVAGIHDDASAMNLVERRAFEQGLPFRRRDFEERIQSASTMRRGMMAYRPERRYPGRMTLLRVEDALAEFPERIRRGELAPKWTAAEDLGWSNWVEELDVRAVPGGHLSVIYEPHIHRVAAIVRELVA